MSIGDQLKLSAKSKILWTDDGRYICRFHFFVKDIIDLIGIEYVANKEIFKRVELMVDVFYQENGNKYHYELKKINKKISKYCNVKTFEKKLMDTVIELLKTLFAVKPIADAPKPISTPPKRPSTSPTDSHKNIITPEQRKKLELAFKNEFPKQQPLLSLTERKKRMKYVYDNKFKKK